MKTVCPHCGQEFPETPEDYSGMSLECPVCRKNFVCEAPKSELECASPAAVPSASRPAPGGDRWDNFLVWLSIGLVVLGFITALAGYIVQRQILWKSGASSRPMIAEQRMIVSIVVGLGWYARLIGIIIGVVAVCRRKWQGIIGILLGCADVIFIRVVDYFLMQ